MDYQDINGILEKLAPIGFIGNETNSRPKRLRITADNKSTQLENEVMYISGYTNGSVNNDNDEQSDYYSTDEEDYNKIDHAERNRKKIHSRYTGALARLATYTQMVNVDKLVHFKASSSKAGNPVDNILDNNPDTYWQSDGSQPHYIDMHFSKKMSIVMLAMYFSRETDESYTPKLVKVYVGFTPWDIVLYKTLELDSIDRWIGILFRDNRPDDGLLKCQFIRLSFPVNHENGKDVHIRGVHLYAQNNDIPVRNQQDWGQLIDPFSKLDNGYFNIR